MNKRGRVRFGESGWVNRVGRVRLVKCARTSKVGELGEASEVGRVRQAVFGNASEVRLVR